MSEQSPNAVQQAFQKRNEERRKRFHGSHVPKYKQLTREEYYNVLQSFHVCPYDPNLNQQDVSYEASFKEYESASMDDLQLIVELIVSGPVPAFLAPQQPTLVNPDVLSCAAKTFNIFINFQNAKYLADNPKRKEAPYKKFTGFNKK